MAEDPGECFSHLLKSLRESPLGWIGAEIEAEIASGRIEKKEWHESPRRVETGLTVEEYSDSEKLGIALQVLRERVQVAYASWTEAEHYLKRRLAIESIAVEGSESVRSAEPFLDGFPGALEELEGVLAQIELEYALPNPAGERLSPNRTPSLRLES